MMASIHPQPLSKLLPCVPKYTKCPKIYVREDLGDFLLRLNTQTFWSKNVGSTAIDRPTIDRKTIDQLFIRWPTVDRPTIDQPG
jgi:hypothetical protein